MKKLMVILVSLIVVQLANGQEDAPTAYSDFFTLQASKMEPAVLGTDFKKTHINLFNIYAWAGNSTFTIDQIMRATSDQENLAADVDNLKQSNLNFHRFGFGANVDLLNLGFRFNKSDDEELFSLSLGAGLRAGSNLLVSNELFQLALKGNKQYFGQTVEIPIEFNSYAALEYSVGVAMPIPIEVTDFEFRGGLRLKYLKGLYGIYTEEAQLSMYSDVDADGFTFIDFGYDYTINSSHNIDSLGELDPSELMSTKGGGFGFDLGFSANYKERWFMNVNLLDIGAIKFRNNGTIISNTGEYRYYGAEVDNILSDEISVSTEFFEDIIDELEETDSQEQFSMPLPSRFRSHISYRIPSESSKGVTYHKHSVGLTYIQGFRNLANANTRPLLSLGYDFNLNNVFEAGANFGLLGYNRIEGGAFVAVRAGIWRFGIGSGNLLGAIQTVGTGVDFNMNMTFAF